MDNQSETNHQFTYAEFQKQLPKAFKSLITMGNEVEENGFPGELAELVKLRVSQINQCVFCTHLHIEILKKLHTNQEKIDLVAVWREAVIFTDREKAAFRWAEQLAYLATEHEKEPALQNLSRFFTKSDIMNLTVAIATINAWNRIAGALSFPISAI